MSSSYYNRPSYGYGGSTYGGYGGYQQPQGDPDQHMKVWGASVGFGKRLRWPDDFFSIYTEVSYQNYDLKDWTYFIMQNGQSHNLSFKVMMSRRSIDNPIFTRNGSDFSLGLEFTPPWSAFSDKDWSNPDMTDEEKYQKIEYHKWKFKGALFKSLSMNQKLVMHGKYEMGFLGYYNKDLQSPFGKFQVGGDGMSGYSMYGSETIGVRGYENNTLTPYNNGAYDGNIYNKLTLELRYAIALQPSATVFALAFAEAGNAWSDYQNYNPFELKRSAGVGLRIFLPIFGLMGIDWGYGFDESNYRPNAGGSQFHFVIGQSF